MNERIRLLADQAWVDNDQLDAGGYTDLAKFAELIILETLDQVNENMELTWIEGEVKIKEHFGVK